MNQRILILYNSILLLIICTYFNLKVIKREKGKAPAPPVNQHQHQQLSPTAQTSKRPLEDYSEEDVSKKLSLIHI